jgi:hypothetical protein
LALFITLFVFYACTKKNGPSNEPVPLISAIFPDNGHYATVLAIIGTHFSLVAAAMSMLVVVTGLPRFGRTGWRLLSQASLRTLSSMLGYLWEKTSMRLAT